MSKQDLLERLGDFDNHGVTATQRFAMRMDALMEIKRLRASLAAATKALEFIRDGYARGDVNHVDYRVGAYTAALDALEKTAQPTPAVME